MWCAIYKYMCANVCICWCMCMQKKNQVLWFGDRYVGSQLTNPSFSEVAIAMGAEVLFFFPPSFTHFVYVSENLNYTYNM